MPALTPDSRVFVAGHRGLVGSAVVRRLAADGVEMVTRTSAELDLRDGAAVRAFFDAEQPTHVVLAAAKVGGILANRDFPADFVGDNLAIAYQVLMAAHEAGLGKTGRVVNLGSSCIYPREAPQPMKEEHLLTGPLEPTNRPYAVAKIAGIEIAEALHRQHGDDVINLMPTNLYGPGDNFDLQSSHVLPALIRRFHEAKGAEADGSDAPVTLWGTGSPKREFLHADDLADAVAFVLRLDEAEMRAVAPDGLLNVGVGEDLSIRELAELIRDVVGAESEMRWDTDKPDGTPRKLLDVSRLHDLGWSASVGLREGVASTYDWFLDSTASVEATA